MGLFDKLFKSKQTDSGQMNSEKQDFSYVCEIAELISDNDSEVMKAMNFCVSDTAGYARANAERFGERGIDINDADTDTICWIGMVDELAENGYLVGVDCSCELEDFQWALEQIKTYSLIKGEVLSIDLVENKIVDMCAFAEEINMFLKGRAFVCMIEIDSDSYELIIVTADVYDKISSIAKANGHSIEDF